MRAWGGLEVELVLSQGLQSFDLGQRMGMLALVDSKLLHEEHDMNVLEKTTVAGFVEGEGADPFGYAGLLRLACWAVTC